MKNLFQKTKFFKKLCPISKSINSWQETVKNIYCWQETFKMGARTTKSRLPINRFLFVPRNIYIKKLQFSIFFFFFSFFQRKKTCLGNKYCNNHKILGGLQPIRSEQKFNQHILCKKTSLNSYGHCSSHLTS